MPAWDESIKGDREAIRIEKEMRDRYYAGMRNSDTAIDIAHAQLIKEATRQSAEMRGSLWKTDIRQFIACCLMALAGLGFAVLIMCIARYH